MSTLAPLPGTGVTKGSIVETAFEYCALAGYEFERTPEEMASGVRHLAMMMMEKPFSAVPFNIVDFGFGLPEEGSSIPNEDVPGIGFALALRIATIMGKTLPASFFIMANPSIYALKARYTDIPQQDFRPGTIRGQGARDSSIPFFPNTLEEDDTLVDPGDLTQLAGE
ncbi:MAG: hypothetical protein ACRC6I_14495 [Paracoccaceae bacterium]